MIKQIDSNSTITFNDLGSNGVKLTYSPNLSQLKKSMIKLKKAVIKFKINTVPNQNCKVYLLDENSTDLYIIDEFSGDKKSVYINITDELQDCLQVSGSNISLRISNLSVNNIDTAILPETNLEYYYKKEVLTNQANYDFDVGKAGVGKINLSNGVMDFSFEDVINNSKTLPLSVKHSFNTLDANCSQMKVPHLDSYKELPNFGVGKGWKTNFNQFVVKETNDSGTLSDGKSSSRYIYINADGNYIIFEKKYFWTNSSGEKIYLPAESVFISQDGELLYLDEFGRYQEVKEETISDSGLTLTTKYEKMQGISLLEQDSEEITTLNSEINSLNQSLTEARNQRTNNEKALILLDKSNEITLLNQEIQELSLDNEEADITLQNSSKPLNDQYKSYYDEYSGLVDERTYMFKGTATDSNAKACYPTVREAELKDLIDQTSEAIDTLSKETTWGTDSKDGVMDRRETNLEKQRTLISKSKAYSAEQLAYEKKKLQEQNELLDETIKEYDELILKKTHQLETILEQTPEIVITDSNNNMLAFSATEDSNIFKLFAIADNYENQILIIFDGDKIESIIDSDSNIIKFTYDDDLLTTVEDTRSRKTKYRYDENQNLIEVVYPSGMLCKFAYDDSGNLTKITNFDGSSYNFEYQNGKVIKLEVTSSTSKISNNEILPIQDGSSILANSISFSYNNYESTSVKNNRTNKVQTYVFDTMGKVINQYENVFENGNIIGNVNAITYERSTDKCSFSIKEEAYAENLLDSIEYENNSSSTISESYIGDGVVCGDDILATSMSVTTSENTILNCDSTNPILFKTLSSEIINKIKSDGITDLLLSGWAKADSAWTCRHNTDYCGSCEEEDLSDIDSYKQARRFEFKATLKYSNNNQEKVVEQYASFDWMNTDWQYLALPVTISEDPQDILQSIAVCFDYTNNTGTAKFLGMALKKGQWEYSEYKNKLKVYSETSANDYVNYYSYDEKKHLIKTSTKTKNSDKEFITLYDYNDNGSLVRSVSFDGTITENFYNEKGSKIKSVTYHKDEPANKFVSTTEYEENGQSSSEFNDFGEKISHSTYIDKTGIVESVTDSDCNSINYGYDVHDDTLLQITTTVDDNVNSNIMHYTGDLLTSLIHNNTEVKFEYNGFGKQTYTEIAGAKYVETFYEDLYSTQTLEDGSTVEVLGGRKITTENALNEKFVSYTNIDGNVTKVEYVDKTGLTTTLLENTYDGYGNLTYSKDNDLGSQVVYTYDEFARINKKSYTQNNANVSLQNSYDKYGNVTITTINIGNISNTNTNNYDYSTPNQKLTSINWGNIIESYTYDKLSRITETKLGNLYSKYFTYLQKGDHTSNLIASEWFGVNGNVKDSLKYSYDINGNIIKVFENGELIVSYEYDFLSRLTRENNKKLGKTTTFEYDAGGNIIRKLEYAYTTTVTDNLSGGTIKPYNYPMTGWKDQLVSYNNESIVYDEFGNPVNYRGSILQWSHGRQLDSFNDIAYKYNADGIRISKTVNSVTTQYYLDGTKILAQSDGNMLLFHYGNEGVVGFTYQGVGEYYYKKNIFGDVIGIIDSTGNEIVKYIYDAWGNHKTYVQNNGTFVDILVETSYTQSGLNNKLIAQISPFRYRSYYYDIETNLYYLNSRYYDPETGRFINADDISILAEGKDIINGLNLYIYCGNNPIMNTDESGNAWWDWLIGGLIAIGTIALAFVTAGAIIAAAPAIASMASFAMGSIGLGALAGTAATVVSIGAGILAVSTIVIGVNNAITTLSGLNPIASLIGNDAYNVVQMTIGVLGYSYISLGSMLPYPSTGDSTPKNLKQQLAMKQVKLNPKEYKFSMQISDPRMPSWLGWQKYSQKVVFDSGLFYEVHYVGNKWLNWLKLLAEWFDFKFK